MSTTLVSQKSNLSPVKQAVLEKYLKAKIGGRYFDKEIARKKRSNRTAFFCPATLMAALPNGAG